MGSIWLTKLVFTVKNAEDAKQIKIEEEKHNFVVNSYLGTVKKLLGILCNHSAESSLNIVMKHLIIKNKDGFDNFDVDEAYDLLGDLDQSVDDTTEHKDKDYDYDNADNDDAPCRPVRLCESQI